MIFPSLGLDAGMFDMEEFFLRFPARIRYLPLATSLCRELCAKVSQKQNIKNAVGDIELCISEACTNAIKHGCGSQNEGFITMRLCLYEDRVHIQIGDSGQGFDLTEVTLPDLTDHPERGYGLYIIKAKMDEVQYVCSKNENFLEMTKYFCDSRNNGGKK